MITVDLPGVNTLVELVLEDGDTHPSRIEDVDGLMLTVAAPLISGRPRIGCEVVVTWVGERGVYSAPARLSATREDRVPLWELRTDGVVEFGTRRRAVRAPLDARVRITAADDEEARWDARSADVSETGVRCRVHTRPPAPGLEVELAFRLDEEDLKVPGVVVRSRAGRGDEAGEVVVELSAGENVARVIRRYVMRRQIQARKVREE